MEEETCAADDGEAEEDAAQKSLDVLREVKGANEEAAS